MIGLHYIKSEAMPPSCHSTASFHCPVSSLSSNPLRIMTDPANRRPSPDTDLTNTTYDSGGPFNPIHAADENNAGYDSFNVDDLLNSELDAPAYWNDAWFTSDDVSVSLKRAYQPEEHSPPFPQDSPPEKVRLLCVPLLDKHLTDNYNSVKELLATYRNLFAKKNSSYFRPIISSRPSRGSTRLWMMKPSLNEAWNVRSELLKPSYIYRTPAEDVRRRRWPMYDDTASAIYQAKSHHIYPSSSFVQHATKIFCTKLSTTETMGSMVCFAKPHGSSEREMLDSMNSGRIYVPRWRIIYSPKPWSNVRMIVKSRSS
jgi:hypothetical protein